ncbi:MAG: [protein-PII] uridylyltransferase [Opitutaceae bacterium]
MIRGILKDARRRLVFTADMPVAQRLAACKAFLKHVDEEILRRHRGGEGGLAIAQTRATEIDALIEHLYDFAAAQWRRSHTGELPVPVSLIALGGYGRGELCPKSDIDLMFLYPSGVKPEALKPFQEFLTQELLYILWDCGLKVGHSSRAIDEAFAEARRDIQTKTALLESRLIAGSPQVFENFQAAYRAYYQKEDPRGYIAARLKDQVDRRAKNGGTVFLQEPNIKNGVGGLRDFQNTLWMARVKLGLQRIEELKDQNYLREEELRDFQRGYDFLLRARHELHYVTNHANDLLNLDNQPRVALGLGYTAENIVERVEAFMQDYYRHAQAIYRISKIVEDRLALTLEEAPSRFSLRALIRSRRTERPKSIDGFILRGNRLSAERSSVFIEDPERLVRVFRHCQQLECTPDLDLQSLVRTSAPLCGPSVVGSPGAIQSFKSILQEAGRVHPTLSLMHELGILGRFVPEFEQLNCLVQHEFYHRYTADIHTLNTIRELDGIYAAADDMQRRYREVLHQCEDHTLLYLILLLHDIGKGAGIQGHAESGAHLSRSILERFGIAAESSEIVVFVIRHHLAMARFWQKHDLDDPATIARFAEMMGDVEKLRFLYVHTFCDARGTSTELWNGYKNTLHTTLFNRTAERLTLGHAAADLRNAERKAMLHRELIAQKVPGVSADEITAHFNLLPERYFVQTAPDEIVLHIAMVNKLLSTITTADSIGSLRPIIEWKDDLNRSFTVANIVTWDRAGLFYRLAGAFSVAGLNILSAKVISRADHIAIDTFHVVEPGRGPVQNQHALEIFRRTVEEALVQNKDLLPDILAQAKKVRVSRLSQEERALHGNVPPVVEVYHELDLKRTIIEIQAQDQIGLLYRIARVIFEHGFDITFARINTERGIAIDTFYVESTNQLPVEDTERLRVLREAIGAVIAPAEEPAAAKSA